MNKRRIAGLYFGVALVAVIATSAVLVADKYDVPTQVQSSLVALFATATPTATHTPIPTATLIPTVTPVATTTATSTPMPTATPIPSRIEAKRIFEVTPGQTVEIPVPLPIRANQVIDVSFQVGQSRRILFSLIDPQGFPEMVKVGGVSYKEFDIKGGPLTFTHSTQSPGSYTLRFRNPGYFLTSTIYLDYEYPVYGQ
jgi:hypothetical protein